MAYFDHIEAERQKQAEEKYKELRKLLQEAKSTNTTLRHDFGIIEKIEPKQISIHDYSIADEHMQNLEIENSTLKKELETYQNFFKSFAEMMPKQSSIHDVLN